MLRGEKNLITRIELAYGLFNSFFRGLNDLFYMRDGNTI